VGQNADTDENGDVYSNLHPDHYFNVHSYFNLDGNADRHHDAHEHTDDDRDADQYYPYEDGDADKHGDTDEYGDAHPNRSSSQHRILLIDSQPDRDSSSGRAGVIPLWNTCRLL